MPVNCIVCGSSDSATLYPDIAKCKNCSHVFFERKLSDEALSKIYCRKYFFGDEYRDYLADSRILMKNFELRLKILRGFLDPSRQKSLFEIGCAYGLFLLDAKEIFDEVEGIDIAEDGVLHAREKLKLNVVCEDLLKHDLGDKIFDVVCMWDTIEHLQNPDLYLKKISGHMQKGALLALTTGDIESVCARTEKRRWRLMHPPTHIHYFSRKTLAKLLSDNRFDIIYNRYCGFHRSLDIAAYRTLALNGRLGWLYDILRRTGLTGISFYLNLYDIMYIVARKR